MPFMFHHSPLFLPMFCLLGLLVFGIMRGPLRFGVVAGGAMALCDEVMVEEGGDGRGWWWDGGF